MKFTQTEIDHAAAKSLAVKVGKLAPKIITAKPGDTETLTLTPAEISSVLSGAKDAGDIAAFFKPADSGSGVAYGRDVSIFFKDGQFTLEFSKKLDKPNSFGSHINGSLTFIPMLSKDKDSLKVSSFSVGSFRGIDGKYIQPKVDEALSNPSQIPQLEQLKKIVETFRVEPDGSVTITVRPAELRDLFLSSTLKKGVLPAPPAPLPPMSPPAPVIPPGKR
jgi:hypothetical protein